jgi:integrase
VREQKGYLFHKGQSWFCRYCDDVLQPDGTVKRKLVCKKLAVQYGGVYRTKASVRPFAQEILAPINRGAVNPASTQTVAEFVEKIYFPQYVEGLRPVTRKGYRMIWDKYLKSRREMSKLALRDFHTIHGQQLLNDIARQAREAALSKKRNAGLSKNSLKHIKSFLSGVFAEAKRLDVLNAFNPMQGIKIPEAREEEETYAYSLDEVKRMLAVLKEPAWTVVLTAALTGLRKGEIRGLHWEDFDGKELSVRRSVWNSIASEPKTKRSKAHIPVVKQLSDALEAHRQHMGKLAVGPIFQAGNGSHLNLENLARRVIVPALSRCAVCRKAASEHMPEGHVFQLDKSLPRWHGWHAFRRGLATNLHQLGVADKTIQAILRHSNVGLTLNVYIKSVSESQVSAMDTLSEKLGICTDLATPSKGPVN